MNKVSMKNVIEEAFTQYSGAVLQSRALVDVRDAIKPSARQIFYCLYTDGFLPTKPFKKTLKAIGSVARLYIHGDASAEGVIMRSAQPFAMRYPLVEVEGNEGNLMESGNWAAPRYSASRLSYLTTKLFEDIKKDTIDDWRDNYDDTEKYPAVLPSKGFYNIVNGCLGLGVGAAAAIPQFNLRDVNLALEKLLLNPNINFDEIYCKPDFATGAYLINEVDAKAALEKGNGGSCKLRAKMEYNERENCFIVTEIPYGVYTNTICKELEGILESENNIGIDRFNDLTGEKPLIKIYLTKEANPRKVERYLYKNTSLQYFFTINLTMLDKGRFPKVFTWKEALQAHINHEKEVYRRGFEYDIKKINDKIHIIDGLLICLASIDEVISVIKSSKSTAEAKSNLIANFKLDEVQAQAVLDMKLARLAKLEVLKLQEERKNLLSEKQRIETILNDEKLFNNELITGWREISEKYGDEHRTKVLEISEEKEEEEVELPPAKDVIVIASLTGGIKRINAADLKVQNRRTKGEKTKDDAILATISTNTVDTLMIFTDKGRMYRLLVDKVPEGKTFYPIKNLVDFQPDENVIAITSLYRNTSAKYVLFFTTEGYIKKTAIEEYTQTKRGKGIAAIKLDEGDSIANVTFVSNENIILVTRAGMAIKFDSDLVTPIGRVTRGVKAIKLNENDKVLCGLPISNERDALAIVTSDGYAKKTKLEDFTLQLRGGKGVAAYKKADIKDHIVSALLVSDEDNILFVGKPNSLCISCKDIPCLGRATRGNLMIKEGKISSAVKI